ncbi:MAG: hypothetical protein WBE20_10960 [Candidatus Acidiferrales bacterium]
MAEPEDPGRKRDTRKRSYEENVPPPRILKLALLAAAIIVVIALIIYFRARHAPPPLRNQSQTGSAQVFARNNLPEPAGIAPNRR